MMNLHIWEKQTTVLARVQSKKKQMLILQMKQYLLGKIILVELLDLETSQGLPWNVQNS